MSNKSGMKTSAPSGRKKAGQRPAWKQGDSFIAYGEYVIAERIAKMLSYAREVRRGTRLEAVHDMRVASRRLRAALSVFEPAFRHADYYRLEKEVKLVTDSLSRARDLDVMILALTRESARIPASQRGVITEIVRDWSVERRRIQGDIVAALDRLAERDPQAIFDRVRAVIGADETPDADSAPREAEPTSVEVTDDEAGTT